MFVSRDPRKRATINDQQKAPNAFYCAKGPMI